MSPAVAAVEAQMRLTIRVIQIKVDEMPRVSNLKDATIPKDLPPLPAGSDAEVRVAGGGGERSRIVAEASAHCASTPRILTHAGQPAGVRMGQEVPGEVTQPTSEPGPCRLVVLPLIPEPNPPRAISDVVFTPI